MKFNSDDYLRLKNTLKLYYTVIVLISGLNDKKKYYLIVCKN